MFDGLLIAFCAGAFAQLLRNLLGRGAGPAALGLMLLCGTPPLLALTALHLAAIFDLGLSALLHHRLGQVQLVTATRWSARCLPGAALALCVLLLGNVQLHYAVLIPAGVFAITHLAHVDASSGFRLRTTAAAALLVLTTSRQLFLRSTQVAGTSFSSHQAETAMAMLLVSSLSSVALSLWLGAAPLMMVLGLLAGAVLATPWRRLRQPAAAAPDSAQPSMAQPDY